MQSYGLPNIATFEEISQKLQRGEVQNWFINPSEQRNGNVNSNISFIVDNKLYSVRARYDQATNQILPPYVASPEVPVTSLIKWENTHEIFNLGSEPFNITPNIPNGYCDDEINNQVPTNYFDSIFQIIDAFKPLKYQYYLRVVPTDMGDQSAMLKQWSNKNARLQFWITTSEPASYLNFNPDPYIMETGWAIIYGDANTFLIVGNVNSHPFVMTPTFTFDNSHGSTSENFDFPSLNLEQVKYLLKTKAPEYVFNASY